MVRGRLHASKTVPFDEPRFGSRHIRHSRGAEGRRGIGPWTRQGNGRALVPADGARRLDLLHGGRGYKRSGGHRSGAPGGSALHLAAERPQGRGSVQRSAEIKRGASADRAEQDRHQRRRQRDRRVVDRRRVAISPRQRRSRIRAIPRLYSSPARPRTSRGGAASMRSGKCGVSGSLSLMLTFAAQRPASQNPAHARPRLLFGAR